MSTRAENLSRKARTLNEITVGLHLLGIHQVSIETKRGSQDSVLLASDPCPHRRTLRRESASNSAQARRDLKVVEDNDEVEVDYESNIAESLMLNYKSVKESRSDSDSESDEENEELGVAHEEMKLKVLKYRETLTQDDFVAQESAFKAMFLGLSKFTILENKDIVERNVNAMIEEAYVKTFKNKDDTSSKQLLQKPESQTIPWSAMQAPSLRDFELVIITEDRKVFLKLSARNRQTIVNKTWQISDTDTPLENMQQQVLDFINAIGAVISEQTINTDQVKESLKRLLCM